MAKRSREERLQIMLTEQELTAVDTFRFKTRMPSRAAAVRDIAQARDGGGRAGRRRIRRQVDGVRRDRQDAGGTVVIGALVVAICRG